MDLPRTPLAALLVAFAVVVAFTPALAGRLFHDDVVSLTQNPALEAFDWATAFDAPDQSTLAGRPVSAFSFALNAAVASSPASYRLGNVALHVAVALVALALARRLLAATPDLPGGATTAAALAPCLVAAWALHPLQTDAVSYAVQRTEILATLFMLASTAVLVRGWSRGGAPSPGLAVGLALLAAGSKEIAVALPFVVACLHRGFFASSWRDAWSRGRTAYLAIAAATWIPVALLVATGPRAESVGFGHGVGAFEWMLTQAQVVPYYLRLVVWPDRLALVYDAPIVTSIGAAAGGLAAMAALLGATLWALRSAPRAGALAAIVFVVLGPTSSFVPIWTEVVAERRMYLPSLAVVALVAVGLVRLAALASRPRVAVGLSVAVLVASAGLLGATTRTRAAKFGDGVEIWHETVTHQPTSAMAHLEHGLALRADNRLDEALAAYERALSADPTMTAALNNMGTTLIWSGRADEAVAVFDRAIALAPDAPGAHLNRGVALSLLGRHAEALASFEATLAIAPTFPGAATLAAGARQALATRDG